MIYYKYLNIWGLFLGYLPVFLGFYILMLTCQKIIIFVTVDINVILINNIL